MPNPRDPRFCLPPLDTVNVLLALPEGRRYTRSVMMPDQLIALRGGGESTHLSAAECVRLSEVFADLGEMLDPTAPSRTAHVEGSNSPQLA